MFLDVIICLFSICMFSVKVVSVLWRTFIISSITVADGIKQLFIIQRIVWPIVDFYTQREIIPYVNARLQYVRIHNTWWILSRTFKIKVFELVNYSRTIVWYGELICSIKNVDGNFCRLRCRWFALIFSCMILVDITDGKIGYKPSARIRGKRRRHCFIRIARVRWKCRWKCLIRSRTFIQYGLQ